MSYDRSPLRPENLSARRRTSVAAPALARAAVVLAALAVTVACAGCELGGHAPAGGVSVRVTTGFGAATVEAFDDRHANDGESVLSLLRRSLTVRTGAAGAITSVDGRAATATSRWAFFVNGIKASHDPAQTTAHKGDRIWLDLHDDRATGSVPAVTGSFPEPFLNGINGRRYPTVVACGAGLDASCKRVMRALSAYKIPVSPTGLGYGTGTDSIDIVVGTWAEISGEVGPELIKYGPGASGVYARFSAHGGALELLDAGGDVARRLGADAGLVAAIKSSQDAVPNWLVTGTDPAGVAAAAAAFTASRLSDRFALAVHGSTDVPLPVASGS